MRQPRKDQRVNVRLDDKLYRKILKLSEDSGEALSVVVRQLLRQSVNEEFKRRRLELDTD